MRGAFFSKTNFDVGYKMWIIVIVILFEIKMFRKLDCEKHYEYQNTVKRGYNELCRFYRHIGHFSRIINSVIANPGYTEQK
jgi:hypothetical protein